MRIRCELKDTLTLDKLTEFQGALKKRTRKDISKLKESLLNEGLLMPFVVWRFGDSNKLLDGHGRLAVLRELVEEKQLSSDTLLPVLYVDAENEDEAKKALLQISSQYGRIVRDGVAAFTATIPTYSAPSIDRFRAPLKRRKHREAGISVIRIEVPADKADDVRALLAKVDYIKVT